MSDYSKGLICISCGSSRTDRSKRFCKRCYYRFEARQPQDKPARVKGESCTHYFIYPGPSGPTAIGVCVLCGDEKVSENTIPYRHWRQEERRHKLEQEEKSA